MSADSGSPSSINPSDQQRSQSRPPSPTRRTLLSEQPQNIQGTPPSTDIVSEQRLPEAAAIQQHPGGMGTEGGGRSVEHSSPSASSSQGDMADNEMEAGPRQPSEPANPAGPPPKKKRTRTLTTPHQSAVLHALLAQVRLPPPADTNCSQNGSQSRFPTTAMREEVGRSIGLSARKVQVSSQIRLHLTLEPHLRTADMVPGKYIDSVG
ncbi:hypothetical protein A0H81_06739 [Grifola frondosa]|uniref:Uncharacterized protein n=1 Tax=Grifola frondosa TaxID=5627 RepID=A0A1C7MD26_GRIFR|nr:hypothetical protein A0H81_06739 [Grifola frondosa]